MLVYSQYILLSKKNQLDNKLKYLGLIIIHFTTSIYIPYLHIFFLFGTGFVIKKSIERKIDLNYFIYNHQNSILKQNYLWIKKYFCLGLVFWIIDFFGCDIISPFHIHWLFHILIGLVSYKIIGLVKYL
jgi:hypothetical protein